MTYSRPSRNHSHPYRSAGALGVGGLLGLCMATSVRQMTPFILRSVAFFFMWPLLFSWALITFFVWIVRDTYPSWRRMRNALIAHSQLFVYWYEGLRPLTPAQRQSFLQPRRRWLVEYVPYRRSTIE
jgi:hypothetical protein